jgi:uncharacterized protein YyaL (SSP411 family)
MPNRLARARSPYLQRAKDQPVDWFEWGDEAFALAKQLDRPILLSVGGVWCHWCHVMAHESFENIDIASFINDHFIPVKVDRDERPDIDRRYQDAVMNISGSGGWPLTAFLTPEGRVFYGGTYFPPEERWQKPGLKSLLVKLAEIYRDQRDRIEDAANQIYQNALLISSVDMKADLAVNLPDKGISGMLLSLDMNHGGIGGAPKFHHATAFEFLINHLFFEEDDHVRKGIVAALDGMAKGGIHDHLLGGFFRYSTDARWLVPHFEKMLHDNAELLKLYSISYKMFGNEIYRSAAEGIIAYYKKYGLEEAGGFYSSQDADIGLLDEGGYYTFTEAELAQFLDTDEIQAVMLYFGTGKEGKLHHDPSKNVLFINTEPGRIAEVMQVSVDTVNKILYSAKRKMLLHREQTREMPYIDKTIYTNWNGLMIEALCIAGNLLVQKAYIAMAEKAARSILASCYAGGSIMHRDGTPGFLEDYIFFSHGLLELFQAIQNKEYLDIAKNLMDRAIALFWDDEKWGFFDAVQGGPGYMEIRIKNIQDTPVQSANGIAPFVLMLLAEATGDTVYLDYAEKTLKAFAGLAAQQPALSYSYLLSLHAHHQGIYRVETEKFVEQALSEFRPYKFVLKSDVDGVIVCEKGTCRKFVAWPPQM